MTRESAYTYFGRLPPDREVLNKFIDKIYDDLESRTCENCIHMKQVSENNKWCDLLEQYNLKYCSEFVSTDT